MFKTIFVESGHGKNGKTFDPGSMFKSVSERQINVALGKKVMELLKNKLPGCDIKGVGVETDATVSDKTKYTNLVINHNGLRKDECLYVAIHCNGNIFKASGVETFYQKNDLTLIPLCDAINNSIHEYFDIPNRKAKSTATKWPWRRLYIDDNICKSVLVECGFMSTDIGKLLQYDRMAEAIVHGILSYFREKQYIV